MTDTYLLDVSHQVEEIWVVSRLFLQQKNNILIRKPKFILLLIYVY